MSSLGITQRAIRCKECGVEFPRVNEMGLANYCGQLAFKHTEEKGHHELEWVV